MQSVLHTLQQASFPESAAPPPSIWTQILEELKQLNLTQKRILERMEEDEPRPTKRGRAKDDHSTTAAATTPAKPPLLEPLASTIPTFTVVATDIWSVWVSRIKAAEQVVETDQTMLTTASVTPLQQDFYALVEKAHLTFQGTDTSTIMTRVMLGQMPISDVDRRTMCDLVLRDGQFPMRWKAEGRAQILWCWQHEEKKWVRMVTSTDIDPCWHIYGRQLLLVIQTYWTWYMKLRCYTNLFTPPPGVSREQMYQNSIGVIGTYASAQDGSANIDRLARTWHDMLKNKSL